MKEGGGGGTTREEDTGWGGGGEGRRGGQMVRAWDELWLRKVTAGVRGGRVCRVCAGGGFLLALSMMLALSIHDAVQVPRGA